MIKSRKRNFLILALVIFAVIGILFFFYIRTAQDDFHNEVTLDINGTATTVLKINGLAFKPGEDHEYVVNLKCKAEGNYNIRLEFMEIADRGLKDYVNVDIICGDVTYKKSLSTFLDGEEADFNCPLNADTATKIFIRYYMPIEVGNEAQGAVADFNVVLTATYAKYGKG